MADKKTAFVTGGAGFLGMNLIEELVANEREVVSLDLNASKAMHLQNMGARLIEGDITDFLSCNSAMPENVDALFHLVGAISDRYDIQTAMTILPLFCLIAAILFFIGSFFYESDLKKVDKVRLSVGK